jgi:hypothetical protein
LAVSSQGLRTSLSISQSSGAPKNFPMAYLCQIKNAQCANISSKFLSTPLRISHWTTPLKGESGKELIRFRAETLTMRLSPKQVFISVNQRSFIRSSS